jgi:hypothetical protein
MEQIVTGRPYAGGRLTPEVLRLQAKLVGQSKR